MIKAGIGIDCGSAACKGVLMESGAVRKRIIRPSGWSPKETAGEILDQLLRESGLDRGQVTVVTTGYGRLNIPFADYKVTEITCHARGAHYMYPEVRTVIDIGGQDSKVIEVKGGRVLNFLMNDKCAAGTGRFLEMTAHRLEVDMEGWEQLLKADKSCSINSMCAVFAESEIVSLLASGRSREEIAGGVIESIAAKACALAGRISVNAPVILTGGLSHLDRLRGDISRKLGQEVYMSESARYAGSIGAALIGMEKESR